MSEKHPTCPICGLAVAVGEKTTPRATSEGVRRVHDRCAGPQVRQGATR